MLVLKFSVLRQTALITLISAKHLKIVWCIISHIQKIRDSTVIIIFAVAGQVGQKRRSKVKFQFLNILKYCSASFHSSQKYPFNSIQLRNWIKSSHSIPFKIWLEWNWLWIQLNGIEWLFKPSFKKSLNVY